MSLEVQVTVSDNLPEERYEARIGDDVAGFLTYELTAERITLLHAKVNTGFEGRGIGGFLVKAALDDARVAGLSVDPVCPFAAVYIERHPEYADLLALGEQVSDGGGSGI